MARGNGSGRHENLPKRQYPAFAYRIVTIGAAVILAVGLTAGMPLVAAFGTGGVVFGGAGWWWKARRP